MSDWVHELQRHQTDLSRPGIYLMPAELAGQGRQFGLKPLRSMDDGKEVVPFTWATEFPPLEEFMRRFPKYWVVEAEHELWRGGDYTEHGVYWCRY